MRAFQGLLWEQWRQSRLWVVAAYAFLLVLTVAVTLYRPWMLAQFYGDTYPLDKFAWALGVTLIGMLFVDQRMREVSLHFPRRLFALPCRTVPLVASQLLYKSAIAALMGVLIALYHVLLLKEHSLSLMPVLMLLALVGVCQSVSMIAVAFGVRIAVVSAGIGSGLAFLFYGLMLNLLMLAEAEAAQATALLTALTGWSVAMAVAPASRHGLKRKSFGGRLSGPALPRIKAPLILEWNFATPVWAHAWYEWRRVTNWTARIAIAAAVLVALSNLGGPLGGFALLSLGACLFAVSVIANYFLLRISRAEHRFLLSRPGGEQVVADGKLLSALLASQCIGLATVIITMFAALVAFLIGEQVKGYFLLHFIPFIYVIVSGLFWILLSSVTIYFFLFVSGFTLAVIFVTPLTLATALEINGPGTVSVYLTGLVLLLYSVGRMIQRRGIPFPWELGLCFLALVPEALQIVASTVYLVELPLPGQAEDRVGLLLPTLLLLGGLFFGLRLKLISEHRAVFAFAGHLILSSIVFAFYHWGFRWGPLPESGLQYCWVAACFAPLLWIPLAVRLQRYR